MVITLAHFPRILAFAAFLTLILLPVETFARCVKPTLAGTYTVKKYSKLGPKIVEIIYNCPENRRMANGRIKAEWELRVFHHCRPANCIWGRVGVKRDVTGVFKARFQTFSAERTVTVIPMGYRIEVQYLIDYRSQRRKDVMGKVIMSRR